MTNNSSDLSDDIVPDEPKHSILIREFAPWHKVRKEFIRQNQWNKFVVRYAVRYLQHDLQEVSAVDEWSADEVVEIPDSIKIARPLTCLVIPGDDLLDIRSLHRDTECIQCYIKYLGFNYRQGSNQQNTRVHIAHNDVTSSRRVSTDSIVLPDLFQMVAKQNSQAYSYLKRIGPFHVVNLDLCDSLFPNVDGNIQGYFNALHAISAYQMKEMAAPWLLFITTEVAPKEVDTEQFNRLCQPTKTNMRHPDFQHALSRMLPTDQLKSDAPLDFTTFTEKQLIDLFGVALGKALLSFCSSAGETWKMEMLRSHIYSLSREKSVSMLSLAFQFTPIARPPQDATGISTLNLPSPSPFNEAELATKLVSSVASITDIDEVLDTDLDLKQSILESSADLLELAGYDREAYLRWVQNGEHTA